MFYNDPNTNAPVAFETRKNYSQTYSGPIKPDQNLARTARTESMAKAAFGGNPRAYLGQIGKGIGAGSKMAAYKAGVQADTEASKPLAQAKQDQLDMYMGQAAPELQFQERQAAEQGYLRDLILDRDDILNRERMAAFKRFADEQLSDLARNTEDAAAESKRRAQFWSSLL